MEIETVRKLADSQLQTFADTDFVTEKLFEGMAEAAQRDFPDGRFRFLDVGGGCGYFADRLLARFPSANGAVLDNSQLLLSQNAPDERKALILASATEIEQKFNERRFDIVFFNLALHHFVGGSYAKTRSLQRGAIEQARAVLAPGGRIAVTENLFDGIVADNLPGFIIYVITSSAVLAPVVHRLGANTAGIGVCFLSARAWRREFHGLQLRETAFVGEEWRECEPWKEFRLRLLGVRRVTRGIFWLADSNEQPRTM